ncbi:hypothetical protein [Victivallis sp. Marseille-Q1083]|uniref:hypothetical protein n=1 Tax=Victivallis sp. Marseille-Q1083 TaxID=2717288 RepID=UPI001588FDAB|nr:hypothetical protein [Victivallis sp. Marseille-Q1083]
MNTGTVNLCIDGYGQSRRLNKETVPAGVFNYTFASKSRSFNHKASGNDTFIVDWAAYRLNQYTVLNQAGTIQNPNEPPFYSLTFLEILSPCDKHIEGYSLHNHDLFDLIASLTYDQLHTLVGAFDYIFEYIPVYHKYKTDESTMLFRRFWDKQLSRYQIIDKNPFLHPNFT